MCIISFTNRIVMSRKLYILFYLLTAGALLFGQPIPEFHPCHNAKSNYKRSKLTPEQEKTVLAGVARSDTFDILHYNIFVDVTNYSGKILKGKTKVLFKAKMDNLNTIRFDLTSLGIQKVEREGDGVLNYSYNDPFVEVELNKVLDKGDIDSVTISYSGTPYQDPVWGGVYFASNYVYNLGIGLSSNPPNFGRVWYPCFDNFVERATYDISVLSSQGRKGYCIGTFIDQVNVGGDSIIRHYRMNQLLPTYLTNFAASNYAEVNFNHTTTLGTVPIQLVAKPGDTTNMKKSFVNIGADLDAMEKWYGKYVWERVGYVLTTVGAMEHPTNIAYPDNVIANGTKSNETLMAHEFGHNWWGNVTTLKTEYDMWIKEGNAEYSSHLFLEHVYGKDYFVDAVKTNHLNVMRQAHQADGKYEPLSGISFENIYGRHSYWKGAAVMHNMRGYLGDSLYKVGLQSILNKYAYSAIDAAQFRDELTASTGVNMTSFFDDQIFQPGFAGFEIDSINYSVNNNSKKAQIFVTQKLRKANHLYTNVPIEISFYNKNWTKITKKIMVSGAQSISDVELPEDFDVAFALLNEDNKLNYARMHANSKVKLKAPVTMPYVEFSFKVNQIKDTALICVQHMWIPPDPIVNNPNNAKISNSHYWIVDGLLPDQFKASATLEYKNNASNTFLDGDLVSNTEDSLILVYRKSPRVDWRKFPYYSKQMLSATDGQGFIKIDTLLMGEYAFANGNLPTVSVKNLSPNVNQLNVYPNPVIDQLNISGSGLDLGNKTIQIFDASGKLISSTTQHYVGDNLKVSTSQLQNGQYYLQILNSHTTEGTAVFVIQR